jgi:hypothetical protein
MDNYGLPDQVTSAFSANTPFPQTFTNQGCLKDRLRKNQVKILSIKSQEVFKDRVIMTDARMLGPGLRYPDMYHRRTESIMQVALKCPLPGFLEDLGALASSSHGHTP